MKRAFFSFFILISTTVLISLSGCYYDNEEDLYQYVTTQQCDTTHVTFSATIKPIFDASCNNCHSTASAMGGIILDTWAGTNLVISNGRLWGSIAWSSGYSAMPKGGTQLSDCELKKIKAWMNAGHLNN